MTDSDNWVEEQDRLAADQAQNVLDVLTRHGYTVVEDATDRAFTVEVREFRAPNGDVFVTACRGFVLPVEIAIVKIASGRGRGITTLKQVAKALREDYLRVEIVEGGSKQLLSRYETTTPESTPLPAPAKVAPKAPKAMRHRGYIAREQRQQARREWKKATTVADDLLMEAEETYNAIVYSRNPLSQRIMLEAMAKMVVNAEALSSDRRKLNRHFAKRATTIRSLFLAAVRRFCSVVDERREWDLSKPPRGARALQRRLENEAHRHAA